MERILRAARVLGIPSPAVMRRWVRYMVAVVLFAAFANAPVAIAAGTLTSASVALSDPQPSATSSYTLTASSVDISTTVHCIKEQFATTSTGSSVPSSMVTTGAAFSGSSSFIPTPGSWTLDATTNGTLLLTNTSGETPASASARTVIFSGITNSNTADTGYYLRLNTYGNTDCTSSPIDNVTVMFINTNGSTLSVTVDDSLSFSVAGMSTSASCDGTTTTSTTTATTIPFGSVTTGANRVACQDLQAATNGTHGYTIYLRYTGAPDDGFGHTITDTTGTNASPAAFPGAGTEAYGYSTDDSSLGTGTADRFTNPSQGWAAATTSNAEIAYESAGVTTSHYHIGHQAGISSTTNPGNYQTTILYTCTPVY